ncbi:hypothetical protein BO78DRAFT_443481 [Aspergillus sclerotiicarbonarius CBS 121057]|uniref:Glycosyltransferase family 69 protein n=1 Tax=Aspergillus sclerotiicarbonarius (strain CBS 121057 / IBT 28362) TaxID=1448318 RepID=A0A319EY35_ASPSB|nr:hypothetical protein BO78DRAFT_443481 [Aspergillus sclerotiicarbonarius CBS 121057]
MSAAHLLSDYTTPDSQFSIVSQESHDLFEADVQLGKPSLLKQCLQKVYFLPRLSSWIRYRRRRDYRPLFPALAHRSRCRCFLSLLPYFVLAVLCILLVLVVLTFTFNPSYTRLPPHYSSLRDTISKSSRPGRGNLRNEKVFIAASLYDPHGELARGHWGSSVLELINLLGEDNTFLSIYENDSGDEGKTALQSLEKQVTCNKSIVYEDHLDLNGLPQVIIPDGTPRIKRIAYLAETRNRALQPLDEPMIHFDKLLYLNDVAFDPIDALQLLFSTNVDDNGVAQYRAACAVDFINPFKFYDTYATRDSEGYSLGLPFFPWFSDSGSGQSRNDVLAGKDAVSVRSCWGGMVAFDAQFFQGKTRTTNPEVSVSGKSKSLLPARFRALQDINLFWDASECCLIHADIQSLPHTTDTITETETGIYMNPFVRVAYDPRTLSWLWTTRRFEKLFPIIYNIVDHMVGLPWFNPRREEIPGQSVMDTVFVRDRNGDTTDSFESRERITSHDGFCGRQGLQVIVPHREEGKKGWETIPLPA